MKTYIGIRQEDGALSVTVNAKPLNPRLDLCNHSPTGFECGYSGSGPAQLALALLAEHLNNDEQAVAQGRSRAFAERVAAHKQTGRTRAAVNTALSGFNGMCPLA